MCHIHLAITNAKRIPNARGFYDNMESSLNVVVKSRGTFHSYIQGSDYSIDLDRMGRVLGLELYTSKDNWTVVPELITPNGCEPRKIRFLDFRKEIEPISFLTNPDKNLCCIKFTEENVTYMYAIAKNLVAEVNVMDELSALWILNLVDDYGFKEETKFRKEL